MKTLILVIFLITGCATTSNQQKKENYNEEGMTISLPQVPKDNINRSIFFNTKKYEFKQPNGFVYEFYYGSGGRYIIVVKPPQGVMIDFLNAEGTLTIAMKDNNPEILSLSVERSGIFVGTGDTRNGNTDFLFELFVPASRYNSAVDDKFSFDLNIMDQY